MDYLIALQLAANRPDHCIVPKVKCLCNARVQTEWMNTRISEQRGPDSTGELKRILFQHGGHLKTVNEW